MTENKKYPKNKNYTVYLGSDRRQTDALWETLERKAAALGMLTHNGEGNVSALVKAIATGEIQLVKKV